LLVALEEFNQERILPLFLLSRNTHHLEILKKIPSPKIAKAFLAMLITF